jgi:glycosyltransferase involved in cell wall biosynthesis
MTWEQPAIRFAARWEAEMKFSVLICTRNRAASLRATLAAIFDQIPAHAHEYEVVVIDNASTDPTRLTVADFIAALPTRQRGRLRYGYEARPEEAHHLALRAAQGETLIWLEDNASLESIGGLLKKIQVREKG